jgi:DNA repair exonuclease SbcCD ATPase subunit
MKRLKKLIKFIFCIGLLGALFQCSRLTNTKINVLNNTQERQIKKLKDSNVYIDFNINNGNTSIFYVDLILQDIDSTNIIIELLQANNVYLTDIDEDIDSQLNKLSIVFFNTDADYIYYAIATYNTNNNTFNSFYKQPRINEHLYEYSGDSFKVRSNFENYEYINSDTIFYNGKLTFSQCLNNIAQRQCTTTYMDTQYQTLLTQYNNKVSEYNSLLSNYQALQTQYDELNGYYESLRATAQQLENENESLTSQLNDMTEERDFYKQQFNGLSQTYTQLVSDYNSLQSQYNTLQSQYNSLQSQYNTLQRQYEQLQNDVIVPKNVIDWLTIIFNSMAQVLNIEILPHIKLYYIFALPLLLVLMGLLLKFVRGA